MLVSTTTRLLIRLTSNATQVQSRTGKYPFPSGLLFFIELMLVNRSEKLQGIMTFPMRRYVGLFGQLASNSKQKAICTSLGRSGLLRKLPESSRTT